MKYNNVKITGHQRTGTHYIAALVCINFLNTKNYVKYYVNHKQPIIVKNDQTAYIYTWRDFNSTAASIFKMRGRFGLQTDDYNVFLNTKYSNMWADIKYKPINVKDFDGNVRKGIRVSTYFSRIKYTPKEWWVIYHKKWRDLAKQKTNIIEISYNDLISDFDSTMLEIAIKLGTNMRSFNNIENKVGWYV